jgi:hypothetical protein
MKAFVMILALMVAAARCSADSVTNLDFRFPIRVVDGQRVDLRYLFAHWHSGANAVTNCRWVLLTGTIADDTPGGWVVDGKTESASGLSFHQKVLVLNPPRAEKQTLENLLAQQKQLDNRNAALKSAATSLQKGNVPHPPKRRRTASLQNVSAESVPQMETNVSNKESAVQGQLSQVDKELAAIPTTNSSKNGKVYRVDFFVFYTGQSQNGMPTLDFGIPTQ